MIKLVTATAFAASIEVDEQGKIIKTSKGLRNFLNLPLSLLEDSIKRNKFQSIKIEEVEEN
jgi:hypothetical protein